MRDYYNDPPETEIAPEDEKVWEILEAAGTDEESIKKVSDIINGLLCEIGRLQNKEEADYEARAALATEAHYEQQPDGTITPVDPADMMPPCECRTWVREEGYDPNFPASWHHHRCQHFKQKAFIKLSMNGTWCVMEPNEAAMALVNDGAGTEDKYLVEGVLLTQDQFDNLGDFNGF